MLFAGHFQQSGFRAGERGEAVIRGVIFPESAAFGDGEYPSLPVFVDVGQDVGRRDLVSRDVGG